MVITDVGGHDYARDVAVQSDGKIVAAGEAAGPSTYQDFGVARYHADGALDPTFGGDGTVTTSVGPYSDRGMALAIQPDGKIVVAGFALHATNSTDDLAIVRYEADGSLDPAFASGGIFLSNLGNSAEYAYAVALQHDGKIVVAGAFSQASYDNVLVMRLDSNGTPDSTFGPNGMRVTDIGPYHDAGNAVAIQPDGKIVVAGSAGPTSLFHDMAVVRYLPNGELDFTFDGDGVAITPVSADEDTAKGVAIREDGRILIGGDAYMGYPSYYDHVLVQFSNTGALDAAFGEGGVAITDLRSNEFGAAIALQPDGKVLVGGLRTGNGPDEFLLARYLANGSLDLLFGLGDGWSSKSLGQRSYAHGLALQADGKIVLAGWASPTGYLDFGLARFVGGEFVPSALPGDYDGDGFADLAIGVPWEDDIEETIDTGGVNVLYAMDTGLSAAGNQFWDQSSSGSASNGDFDGFGYSAASGDFNGDGFADLATGAPGKVIGAAAQAGAVSVLYGSPIGLVPEGSQQWHQDSTLVEDVAEANDFFGWSVAAGDFNGDGFDDLAIGVPGERLAGRQSAGSVNVLYGSDLGLTATGDQFWHQNSAGIADVVERSDQFGFAVAAGDFDRNGRDDLAVGAPREDLGRRVDGGVVHAIYGSPTGLTAAGADYWHQNVANFNDQVERGDLFGYQVASGNFGRRAYDDLLIGVPAEDLPRKVDAGAVSVVYGTASGLTVAGDQLWHQDSRNINDVAEAGDEFALALTAGDFDGDGYDDAAIGVPAENVGRIRDAGAVSVIYGTSRGLAAAGDQFWHQNSSGIADVAEADDLFGYSVIAANFGRGAAEDLAIGVVLEKVGSVRFAGAANVIYGSSLGLRPAGNQFWNQNSPDVLDVAEFDDEFGFGLAQPGSGASSEASNFARWRSD